MGRAPVPTDSDPPTAPRCVQESWSSLLPTLTAPTLQVESNRKSAGQFTIAGRLKNPAEKASSRAPGPGHYNIPEARMKRSASIVGRWKEKKQADLDSPTTKLTLPDSMGTQVASTYRSPHPASHLLTGVIVSPCPF